MVKPPDMTLVPQSEPEREAYLKAHAPGWYRGRMPNLSEFKFGSHGHDSVLKHVDSALYKFCIAEHLKNKKEAKLEYAQRKTKVPDLRAKLVMLDAKVAISRATLVMLEAKATDLLAQIERLEPK